MKSVSLLFYLIIFTVLTTFSVKAQDKIMLLNGKVLECKIVQNDKQFEIVTYNYTKKNNKIKEGEVEHYRIFSIIDADGKETVYYKQDSIFGNLLAETEMRKYILGERDADIGYKPWVTTLGGVIIGAGFTVFDTYKFDADKDPNTDRVINSPGMFKSEPGMLNIAIPLLYTIAVGIPKIKVRLGNVSHTQYLNDEYYLLGYEKRGRAKKVFGALKGSVAGVVLGLGSYFIFRP